MEAGSVGEELEAERILLDEIKKNSIKAADENERSRRELSASDSHTSFEDDGDGRIAEANVGEEDDGDGVEDDDGENHVARANQ